MLLHSAHLLSIGALLLASWILQRVVYAFFSSPLRKIPGPFLARLTPLWLRFVDLAGNRTSTIHQLHERYGSTVLIGPDEVSFAAISNVKDIYGQQTTFLKAPVYESLTLPPNGVFSIRDKTAHGQRRKLLSHAFSQSNLYDCEPLINSKILILLEAVQNRTEKPIDMLTWFRLAAFDIVGELFLGQSFGGLESGVTPQFLSDIKLFFILADLQWNNPWLSSLLRWIPLPSVRHFLGSMQRLGDYGEKSFQAYIDQFGRKSGRRDLLTKILSLKPESGQAQLTDKETSLEVGNLIFAGTDTTSTTLTFLFWELSKHLDWQTKLRDEILAHTDSSPTFQQVQDLPVLEAVINEALRLHPAAPASLPRETPIGGRELNGYFIPEKTIVSMQCYTTQRDPKIFPDAAIFKPERWLSADNVTWEMKEAFMPFSKGTRACLGKNLAMMELKLITAYLARSFEWRPARFTTEESMAIKDHFLLLPAGGKCELIFNELCHG